MLLTLLYTTPGPSQQLNTCTYYNLLSADDDSASGGGGSDTYTYWKVI